MSKGTMWHQDSKEQRWKIGTDLVRSNKKITTFLPVLLQIRLLSLCVPVVDFRSFWLLYGRLTWSLEFSQFQVFRR